MTLIPRIACVGVVVCALFPALASAQQASGDGYQVVVPTSTGEAVVRRTPHAVSEVAVHAVPGDAAFSVTWTEWTGHGPESWYAVSPDGRTFPVVTATDYLVKLRYAAFDPKVETPSVPAHLDSNLGGNLWLVQYWSQPLEAYFADLTLRGARILNHVRQHATLVSMDPAVAQNVATLPYVRAIASYQPAYRLDETLLKEQIRGWSSEPVRKVNIMTATRGLAGQGPVSAHIRSLGGRVDEVEPETFTMRATLTLAQVASVSRLDEVVWVDLWSAPEEDMDVARTFHGATYAESVGGFDGTGVRGEVLDSGCLDTHQEFQNPPLLSHGAVINGSHGTSTTGQIFATGVDPTARGMLPNGQGVRAYYSALVGSRYNHTSELVNPALPFQCVFQSNSWGGGLTTTYTSDSAAMDLILFDFPRFVITQSQSNNNSRNSRPQALAKNIVSVGGVDHVNTLSATDDNISSASRGPTDDGRTKPEIASFYDNIRTTSNTSSTSYTNSFGGTSGATPIVGGSFGLFFQMWHAGIFGNVTGASVFDSRPNNTLSRAMILATGTQWDWTTGAAASPPVARDEQGFGRPDLQKLYDNRNAIHWIDETEVLAPFASYTANLNVLPGTPELKAVLVWRDPPALAGAAITQINNLDLRITSPTGQIYLGNAGLTNGLVGNAGENLYSTTGGTADTANTVECVFVSNPAPGTWNVEVIATNVVADNHLETAALDADFGLAVLGVDPQLLPVFNLMMSTTGVGDGMVALSNIPAGTVQGFCLFSEDTSGSIGDGNLFGLRATPLTLVSLQQPAAPGALFHWTYPVGASLFPEAPFVAAPGSIPPALFPMDGRAVAIDGAFNFAVTPIRRVN